MQRRLWKRGKGRKQSCDSGSILLVIAERPNSSSSAASLGCLGLLSGINPLGIHINGFREVMDCALEALSAYLAVQVSDRFFLVKLAGYGVLMVTVKASEGRI